MDARLVRPRAKVVLRRRVQRGRYVNRLVTVFTGRNAPLQPQHVDEDRANLRRDPRPLLRVLHFNNTNRYNRIVQEGARP